MSHDEAEAWAEGIDSMAHFKHDFTRKITRNNPIYR